MWNTVHQTDNIIKIPFGVQKKLIYIYFVGRYSIKIIMTLVF